MAMLYLVLFTTLALGFYEATTMSVQVAKNERSLTVSQYAAESGLQFARYQLGTVVIPTNTPTNQLLNSVYSSLQTSLNGTSNMNGDTVGMVNGVINIPSSSTNYIMAENTSGARFRITVAQTGDKLVVTSYGRGNDANVSRIIQLQFSKAAKASAIFNYGVATKGKLTTGGASYILGQPDPAKGSVLSTDMADSIPIVIGGKQVSGDVSISNPNGSISYSAGTSIGGTSDASQIPNHIHIGVPAPLFPTVDTTPYQNAVTLTTYDSATMGNTLTNVIIPPNTNPQFTGNATITGVLVIQAPNVVTFKGNAAVQGVIVEDTTTSPTFDALKNKLIFSGSVNASPVSTLPNTAQWTSLRPLTGAFILAPDFNVNFSGDFGTIGGSIISGELNMTGNATGIVQGSVIDVNNTPSTVNGSSDIVIASTGTSNYPPGVSFGYYYTPLPDTYAEVVPQ
jgi:Tfp pilus assembly protein PilX